MPHVIRKKRLHVEFDGPESEVSALQRRLERFCYDCLVPVMEVALNGQIPEDEHLLMEEVVIDAGTIPLDRMELDLTGTVQEGLRQALREELLAPRTGSRRRNNLQAMTEVFLHFLEYGSLPWWFQLPAGRDLQQVLLERWQDPKLPAGAVSLVLEDALVTLRREEARTRLVLQFSETFCSFLLSLVAPSAALRVQAVLDGLEGTGAPAERLLPMRRKLWDHAFAAAASHCGVTERELVRHAWFESPCALRATPGLAAALERQWPEVTQRDKKGPRAPSEGESAAPLDKNTSTPARTPKAIRQDQEAIEELYIDHAGLVLLHPYLPQLFESQQIAKGNRIIDQERCLAMLHYLAAGDVDQPEHLLVLPKLLCNIPLHVPAAKDTELSDEEREECDALLYVMLQHWGALRNSSADGLRGSFLMRQAKLTMCENDEWLLQVERNSYDILLDQLPYSISMVKLPWMEKLLWVQWD
ncbi:contractile injection system tape measure protein [Geomonas ferrireducens]|uniref:contractile injection system tape measure protein n=1 Tax=Geomonas ferrireducens TaxID=2570227 RepID=UPI0010A780AC|nr:contractile injection system tape measure protein [Geomonas ferrireducens]